MQKIMCYERLPFCPVFGAWKSLQEGLERLRKYRGLRDSTDYAKNSKNCISLQYVPRAKKC